MQAAFISFISFVSFVSFMSFGSDWPQFRGPGGQGHSTEQGLPVEWSETKNIAWKVPVDGRGWSSPVVSAGRVWLTTATPTRRDTSLRLMAFDVDSGRSVVDVEVFKIRTALQNPKTVSYTHLRAHET